MIIYQYEVCPFCNKVRAVLDYYKVSAHGASGMPLLVITLCPTECCALEASMIDTHCACIVFLAYSLSLGTVMQSARLSASPSCNACVCSDA